jgi:hypothetical protein
MRRRMSSTRYIRSRRRSGIWSRSCTRTRRRRSGTCSRSRRIRSSTRYVRSSTMQVYQ